jgi:DNA-binding GntR family transcriptional regulator
MAPSRRAFALAVNNSAFRTVEDQFHIAGARFCGHSQAAQTIAKLAGPRFLRR